jgi:hypothetical protein
MQLEAGSEVRKAGTPRDLKQNLCPQNRVLLVGL